MRIVAIETSGKHGSLAALAGGADGAPSLCQIILAGEQRTAQGLAPAMRSLLAEVGWPPASVQLVAVTSGPGSFTGLRIGVTTAKAFAYAVGANVIGVPTLTVLASQAQPQPGPLWAILDAQRQELFAARFDVNASDNFVEPATAIVPQDTWLAELKPGDCVTGPALRRMSQRLPSGVTALAEELWQPTAAAVGQLAWQMHMNGLRGDVWQLTPKYYRPSAAEEKLTKK